MISQEILAMIQAQGECLHGMSKFLQICRSLEDVQNMALLLRVYLGHETASWCNELLDSMILEIVVKIAAGEDPEGEKHTALDDIAYEVCCFLRSAEEADLEFVTSLLKSIVIGHTSKQSPQAAVSAFMKDLDVPSKVSAGRATKAAAKGHKKKAA
jgi:hypothetical protein